MASAERSHTMQAAAEVIGCFVPPHDYLQWLLPMLCAPSVTSETSAALLHILSCALKGAGVSCTAESD